MFFLLITLILLIIIVLSLATWAYFRTFFNQKKHSDIHRLPTGEQYEPYNSVMKDLMDEMENIIGENVTIRSFDKKKLYGIYYHVSDNAPLHIQFHGYKGNYLRDFCGGNKLARDMGHNTLVIQQRAHGQSSGRTITFGIKERYDCLAWVRYACNRFGNNKPIFLSGVSMGASTVLMASDLELPKNIIGIIADCPYTSPKEIIKKVAQGIGYPPSLIFPLIWLGGIIYGHFNILSSNAVISVQRTQIPILLIHGEDDRFVPCEMSYQIYEASNKNTTHIVTFKNAGHGMSYMVSRDKYNEEAAKFINSSLENYNNATK